MPRTKRVPNPWSTDKTKRFLLLLKKYPVLHERVDKSNKYQSIEREAALADLFEECARAHLSISDRELLRRKIQSIKRGYAITVDTIKGQLQNNPGQTPIISNPWFTKAHFLDVSGAYQRLRKQLETNTSGKRKFPLPIVDQKVPLPHLQGNRSKDSSSGNGPVTSGLGIKVEVNEGYDHEDEDDDMEGDEEEDKESDTEDELEQNLADRLRKSPRVTNSSPKAKETQPPVNPSPPETQSIDSFHAFLMYTKLRCRNYSARQKREITNVLTSAMNQIDEENEALAEQDYNIQMYSSINEFTDQNEKTM